MGSDGWATYGNSFVRIKQRPPVLGYSLQQPHSAPYVVAKIQTQVFVFAQQVSPELYVKPQIFLICSSGFQPQNSFHFNLNLEDSIHRYCIYTISIHPSNFSLYPPIPSPIHNSFFLNYYCYPYIHIGKETPLCPHLVLLTCTCG